MRYRLDRQAVTKRLKELGDANISRFASRTGVHRNTMLGYFRGKPVFASAFVKIAQALGRDPLALIVPDDDHKAGLGPVEEIRPVISALLRQGAGVTIVLLGSRARGRAGRFSDWDLGVLRPSKPISGREFLALRGVAAEASDHLVRHVDVINLDAAPAWFWEEIDYPPVFLDGDREGFSYLKGVLHGIKKNRQAS